MLPNTVDVPQELRKNALCYFGAQGEAWLRSLPEILAYVSDRWNLQIEPHFDGLSINYVAPATGAAGREVVVKLGVPCASFAREIAALGAFAGSGIVRLVDAEPERGVMLLERLRPGELISKSPCDDTATREVALLMTRLWCKPPETSPFAAMRDWFSALFALRETFANGAGPFSPRLWDAACACSQELLDSMAPGVLLHGDLHHFNVVSAQREPWLIIDPKGLVGEPAYEVAAWLCNPPVGTELRDLRRIFRRRVAIFEEVLGLPRARMARWGVAHYVLGVCQAYEPGEALLSDWIGHAETLVDEL